MSSPWDDDSLPDIAGLLQQQHEQTTTANVGPVATPFGKPLRQQAPTPTIPTTKSKNYDSAEDVDDENFQNIHDYLKGKW